MLNIYKKITKYRVSNDTKLISVAKFPPMGLTVLFKNKKIIKTPLK